MLNFIGPTSALTRRVAIATSDDDMQNSPSTLMLPFVEKRQFLMVVLGLLISLAGIALSIWLFIKGEGESAGAMLLKLLPLLIGPIAGKIIAGLFKKEPGYISIDSNVVALQWKGRWRTSIRRCDLNEIAHRRQITYHSRREIGKRTVEYDRIDYPVLQFGDGTHRVIVKGDRQRDYCTGFRTRQKGRMVLWPPKYKMRDAHFSLLMQAIENDISNNQQRRPPQHIQQ